MVIIVVWEVIDVQLSVVAQCGMGCGFVVGKM